MSLDDELSDITDNRVVAMAKYVLMTLNTKSDKWIKMYSNEANADLINQFLNKCEVRMLLFTLSSTGVFQVIKLFLFYSISSFNRPIFCAQSCSDGQHPCFLTFSCFQDWLEERWKFSSNLRSVYQAPKDQELVFINSESKCRK